MFAFPWSASPAEWRPGARRRIFPAFIVGLFLLAPLFPGRAAAGSSTTPSPVLDAMQAELNRSLDALKSQPQPPYFLAYEVTDIDGGEVAASFGTITSSNRTHDRLLRVDLRVGDYSFDNTHQVRGDMFGGFFDRYNYIRVPIEDDVDALRSVLWSNTDKAYKKALEQYTKAKAQVQVKVEEEDKSDDFTHETAAVETQDIPPYELDLKPWEEKLKAYTAPFAAHGRIYQAEARLTTNREIKWFVSSDGSRIQTPRIAWRLAVTANTKADDGMEMPRYETWFSFTPEGLPDDATVLATVGRMIDDLEKLRVAPVVDPYTGPAILSGRASSVFFHEIFGHRVEGHRQRNEEEGQTFKKMIHQKVLPENFSVIFDPTTSRLVDTDLAGSYSYDDEGVAARKVTVVEKGVLQNFLMCRKPINGFPGSNGHGRCQAGFKPVSRQSNLVVQVDKPVSREALKKMLTDRLKKDGKPFGLLFDNIAGGFTMTGRTIPNAFNVIPVMVYRITPDGKEELVRGVDLIGTPLTAFSHIVAGDDDVAVFNGTCGAESGMVPATCISPGILVDQIEVQKKEKSQERPPLLEPPQRPSLGM